MSSAAGRICHYLKLTGLAIFVIMGITAFLLALDSIGDSDPLGYYQVLDLPIGVPQRVTTSDAREAHSLVMRRIRDAMGSNGCDDIDEWELEVPSDSLICAELRAQGEHANRAVAVLSHAPSKVDYDAVGERKDYYTILRVTRDTSIDDVRASYLSLTAGLVAESDRLRCDRFGGTVPSADERATDMANKAAAKQQHKSTPKDTTNDNDNTDASTATGSSGASSASSYDAMDATLKEDRRLCLQVKRRRSELNEAVLVIGDEASRAVYSAGDQKPDEGLNFVSQPLAMVQQSTNPLRFIFPLIVVFGVVYFLTQMNPPQVEMHESNNDADHGHDADEKDTDNDTNGDDTKQTLDDNANGTNSRSNSRKGGSHKKRK